MAKQLKSPLFWSIVSFALGMAIGAWGWDKNESTIAARTHGAVFLMCLGGAMIVAGLGGMLHFGSSKNNSD